MKFRNYKLTEEQILALDREVRFETVKGKSWIGRSDGTLSPDEGSLLVYPAKNYVPASINIEVEDEIVEYDSCMGQYIPFYRIISW